MESHGPVALRAAYLITRNAADAEDVMQESLIKAHRKLGSFEGRSSFRTWLLRIVTNQALNHVRAASRRSTAESRLVPAWEGTASSDAVLEAVLALGDDDRAVIACRFYLDLSQEETAETLGLPIGTVKSRQSAAIARLRAHLAETLEEANDDR
jgi:RNA polymerase sigma-70 factor (ECF subfamily)